MPTDIETETTEPTSEYSGTAVTALHASPEPRRSVAAGVWIALTVVALLVAAAVLYGILSRATAERHLAQATHASAVQTVTVIHPTVRGTTSEIALPGNTQAYNDTPIYARTSGYLKQWFVDIGAHVRKGQLMAIIETPEVDEQLQVAQANLKSAEADLGLANTTSARYQSLLKSDSVSKQETDVAIGGAAAKQAAVDAAQANVRRLQQLQSFERVYAPFAGVVTVRNTDIGALIDAGSANGAAPKELFRIASVKELRVFVAVPETYAPAIRNGDIATLTLDEYPGQQFTGKITRNSSAIDPASRTLNVEVDVDNSSGKLLPGAYVFVHFKLPQNVRMLSIPANTLLFRAEGLRVAVVRDGHVHLQPITIGKDHGDSLEVATGLSEDDAIILDPSDSIAEGQPVAVSPAASGGAMRVRVKLGVLSAIVMLLGGCMVGPKYKAPAVPTPPAFKEASPDALKETTDWRVAKPADQIPRGAWWTMFGDAELDRLEPQVETANQTLKAADANLRAARANIRVQNADRFPTVGLSPFVGGLRNSANQPYSNPANSYNGLAELLLPLQLNYEVDLWGRVRRNIAAATEESQATAADRQTALLSLQAELAMDYFELRAADAQQKLLNDTVTQYAEAYRVTNNRFLGGIAGKSDVTQAQTQLQAAKVEAADIVSQRAQFEHAIAILIGEPPSALTLPASPLNTVPPAIPAGLPSQLLERRPDIAAGERRAAEANEQIGIARAAFFPSLGLSGSAGFESTSLLNLFSPSSFVYTLGPTLGQTFFDGGRRHGLSEQAIAGYDRNVADYRQTVLTAYQQVEDNLVALRVLADEAEQQRLATAAARESERIFNNRYVGGVDTYLQVITAQTTALNNERNDIDILRRRMEASVLLVKALGGGWDRTQLPPR